MADTVGENTSDPKILQAQKDINALMGGKVITPNGEYDKKTVEAIKQFQRAVGIPVTGQFDSATQKAINDEKGINRYEVTLPSGEKAMVTTAQLATLKQRARANAVAAAEAVKNKTLMYKGLYDDAVKLKSQNPVLGWCIEQAGDAPKLADVGKWVTRGVKAGDALVSAANSATPVNPKQHLNAVASAGRAIQRYRDAIFEGGDDLITGLQAIQSACELTLKISMAVATAGVSTTAYVGSYAALGAYQGLLKGIDKSGKDLGSSASQNVALGVAKGAIVEGGLALVFAGGAQPKGGKALLDKLKKTIVTKGSAKGFSASSTFVGEFIAGSSEEFAKQSTKGIMGKLTNPKSKASWDEVFANAGKSAIVAGFVKGFSPGFKEFYAKNGAVFKPSFLGKIPAHAEKGLAEHKKKAYEAAAKAAAKQILDGYMSSNAGKKAPPCSKKELTKKIKGDPNLIAFNNRLYQEMKKQGVIK
ncbi:MAG: peptidoglycan-binding domain-containing protein [Pseudomonadota bacterium]